MRVYTMSTLSLMLCMLCVMSITLCLAAAHTLHDDDVLMEKHAPRVSSSKTPRPSRPRGTRASGTLSPLGVGVGGAATAASGAGSVGGAAGGTGGIAGAKGGQAGGTGGIAGSKGGEAGTTAGIAGSKGGEAGATGGIAGSKGGNSFAWNDPRLNPVLAGARLWRDMKSLILAKYISVDATNQGTQQTCWAYSLVGAIEAAHRAIDPAYSVKLATNYLIKCMPASYAQKGADPAAVLAAIKGVPGEFNWQLAGFNCATPFADQLGTIRYSVAFPAQTCTGTNNPCVANPGLEAAMLSKMQATGLPYIVYVDPTGWLNYKSGPFDAKLCSSAAVKSNHLVLLVGITADKKYWIVKNSWGRGWGEGPPNNGAVASGPVTGASYSVGGYIFLPFGVNACGVSNYPLLVSIDKKA